MTNLYSGPEYLQQSQHPFSELRHSTTAPFFRYPRPLHLLTAIYLPWQQPLFLREVPKVIPTMSVRILSCFRQPNPDHTRRIAIRSCWRIVGYSYRNTSTGAIRVAF